MEKYIKIDSGNLYSYNEKGFTIILDSSGVWQLSSLTYVGILYSDRRDYQELDEDDVICEYGEKIVKKCKAYFNKINSILSVKKR